MSKIEYKVIPLFPEQVTSVNRLDTRDVELVGDYKVNNTFSVTANSIELHAYSQTGILLKSDYKYGGYSFLATAAGAGKDGESTLDLNPVKDAIDLGYNTGDVRLVYNFVNNLYSPSNKNPLFYIESISSDRKELRLLTTQLPNAFVQATTQGIKDALDADSYFSEFRLNFLNNTNIIGINISTELYRDKQAVLVKLYRPLPSSFREKDTCSLVEFVSDSVAYEVVSETIPDKPVYVPLAGPNFDIDVEDQRGTPSPFYDYNELFSYPISSSYYELMALSSESGSAVSIDHEKFEQFIHFSSAEERLRNFKYKLELIQSYSGSIAELKNQNFVPSQNQVTTGSIERYEKLIEGVVNNFDHYDRYLYFESSSTAWPKVSTSRPFILASSSATISQTWFTDNIASASNYDVSNNNALTNAIPAFIREDSDNNDLLTFIYMLGQHFDNIWIYQKALGDKYDGDNRIDYGISRDLVADALKSFGVKLYSSNESLENLFSYFTGQAYQSGSSQPTATHVTASSGANAYLQPMPKKAYMQEVHKRIYHNLSYLLKSKGTERGLRALINCYGIPSDILNITVHGNIDYTQDVYLSPEEPTSATYVPVSSSLGNIVIDNTGSYVEGLTLSQYNSIERKTKNRSTSLHTLDVGFSPSDNINLQLHSSASAAGGLNIDDYIGAPTDAYESKYTGLQKVLEDYTKDNSGYDLRDFVNLIRFFDNTLFKSIKDYIPARSNASVGIIIKPNVLDRSKVKQVSGSMTQPEYSGSKSMYVITGSQAQFGDSPYYDTASYNLEVMTPSGSTTYTYHNFENAKFDGEFSGSILTLTTQSLNPGNQFKAESGLNLLFDYDFFDSSFQCDFSVKTFIPVSVTPTVTPTISVTPSETPVVSPTPSRTPTISVTPSRTPTISVTPSVTPTRTPTISITPSRTPTISVTPSRTPSVSVTRTPTISVTPSISISSTPAASATRTPSRTPSISVSRTPSITVSPTRTPSRTPSISVSKTPSRTPSVSVTRTPSRTPSVSVTRTPSRTPSISVTRTRTPSRTPSVSKTRTPSRTPSVSKTPSISITPSKTPSKSVTPSKSALNLSQISMYYGSTESSVCNQASLVTFYVQNPYQGFVSNTSRVYSNSAGTSHPNAGWLGAYLTGPSGTKRAEVSSNGYVSNLDFCDECVVAGTMISTGESTSVAVETLASGSQVLSSTISGLPNTDIATELLAWSGSSVDGTSSTAGITNYTETPAGTIWNFNDGLLKTTGGHVHIVKRDNEWRMFKAESVQVGDYFKHQDGSEIEITSISIEGYSGNVYRLNIEPDDVYYANGILTHNIKDPI